MLDGSVTFSGEAIRADITIVVAQTGEVPSLVAGDYICISEYDNGSGMGRTVGRLALVTAVCRSPGARVRWPRTFHQVHKCRSDRFCSVVACIIR